MAQSRVTAKNTFGEGLIMDFAPDTTQATVLTNALNATFLTNNGNESSLQNDMGNGRVESAFLPEGYIPVGVCEFGGIIYIASYNPQDNLCQIGSFPSPERNITKEDKTANSLQAPILTGNYFQELKGDEPTGKLKSLVSKVILRQDALNPGDKYIIESSNRVNYTQKDIESLTGLSNDGTAKRLKLSVVSIEDSGQITKLETLNYEVNTELGTKYFNILNGNSISDSVDIDIDAYRQNIKQNYNVFSPRVPGKLAILAELEVINEFSCGHRIVTNTTTDASGVGYTTYDVYLDYRWESQDPTITPKYITLTDFTWKSSLGERSYASYINDTTGATIGVSLETKELVNCNATSSNISGNILTVNLPQLVYENNSYFYHTITSRGELDLSNYNYIKSIYSDDHKRSMVFNVKNNISGETEYNTLLTAGKDLGEIEINNTLELSNTVYLCSITIPRTFAGMDFKLPFKLNYEITPAMDFGLLEHLAVKNEIDFAIIGTKLIETSSFKYYVSPDLVTLNIDSDIYEEENHRVSKAILEFYDPFGFVGSYFIEDRESYSGNLTVNIPLESFALKPYKYNDEDTNPWYHNSEGTIFEADSENVKLITNDLEKAGDIGILHANMLYGIKLIYIYSTLNPLTEISESEESIEKGLWLYTTGQFNDYYYSVDDYRNIQFQLPLQHAFKLSDRTSKKYVKLSTDTQEDLQKILNQEYEGIEKLVTFAEYSGKLNLDLSIGVAKESLYSLIENSGNISKDDVDIILKLSSPYIEGKTYSLIEQLPETETEVSEDSEDFELFNETVEEYTKVGSNAKLVLDKNELTLNSKYSTNTQITLQLPELEFETIPQDFKEQMVKTTILTPILYKDSKDGYYNYEDVGGSTMFTKALCYTGSDDKSSDQSDNTSDDRWYETSIADNFRTYDSLIYEYDKGVLHTNITDGHESLVEYYNTLGNRQPFTLFTIQRPQPDANCPEDLSGYSVYWTHNIEGPGNVATYPSSVPKYKWKYDLKSNKNYCVIHKQAKNGASEYSPDYADRSYLPAYITSRIANGGHEVTMTSSGGYAGESLLYYTAHTAEDLRNNFYKSYLQTMKELITVNPDIQLCQVGTFTFNEEACHNLELDSIITANIKVSNEFVDSARTRIAFRGCKFDTYLEKLLNFIDPQRLLLKETDSNVNAKFDISQLGDGEPTIITYINYIMPHEHQLIEDFTDFSVANIVKYINGYYDEEQKEYVNAWSDRLYKISKEIDDSKFYMLYKPKGGTLDIKRITKFYENTDKDGHIYTSIIPNFKIPSQSDKNYQNFGFSLFYNTNMSVDDFTWDASNSKHHFYFSNEHSLTPVNSAFSYQLDDDYGVKGDLIVARPYYIGPSFTLKFTV